MVRHSSQPVTAACGWLWHCRSKAGFQAALAVHHCRPSLQQPVKASALTGLASALQGPADVQAAVTVCEEPKHVLRHVS